MSPDTLALVRQGLSLAVFLLLPVVAAGLLASAVTGVVQAITGWRDPAIGQAPRLLTVCLAWAVCAPWIADEMVRFAQLAWGSGA